MQSFTKLFRQSSMALGLLVFCLTLFRGSDLVFFNISVLVVLLLLELLFRFRMVVGRHWTPYHFLLFSPSLLIEFSSVKDFQMRLSAFLLIVFILYITYAWKRLTGDLTLISLAKKPILIWLLSFLIPAAAAFVVYNRGIHLSGDEPHYIMMAQSIVEDADLDLRNQVEGRTYLNYIPVEIPFHGSERNGYWRSFHLPGLSVLLLPFYWVFKLSGETIPPALFFRLAAVLINSFFGLLLFFMLRNELPGKNVTLAWIFFIGTFPLVFHSIHLYPEIPAATLLMGSYLAVFAGPVRPITAGICLAFIPWLHVKYIPALIVMSIITLLHLLGSSWQDWGKNFRLRQCLSFVIPISLGFLGLILYSKNLYGSLNPMDVYPKEDFWSVPMLLRLKMIFAYFLDQRDGLVFYSPVFLLFFWSFLEKIPGRTRLLLVFLAYSVFHALTSARGAYSPAGRTLMFVSWIMIILVISVYKQESAANPDSSNEENSFLKKMWRMGAGFSLFYSLWLFYNPLFLYQPVFAATTELSSALHHFFSSDSISPGSFFPAFQAVHGRFPWINLIWLFALSALLLFHYSVKKGNKSLSLGNKFQALIFILIGTATVYLFAFHPRVHLLDQNRQTESALIFFNNSANFKYNSEKGIFRLKSGLHYDLFIDVAAMKNRGNHFNLKFFLSPGTRLEIRNGRRFLFDSCLESESSFLLDLTALRRMEIRGSSVIPLSITTYSREKNDFLALIISEPEELRSRIE